MHDGIAVRPASLFGGTAWLSIGWQAYTLCHANGDNSGGGYSMFDHSPCNSEVHSTSPCGPGSHFPWFSVPSVRRLLVLITVFGLWSCCGRIYRMVGRLSRPILARSTSFVLPSIGNCG